MQTYQKLLLSINLWQMLPAIGALPILEQFKQKGYLEICSQVHTNAEFKVLYDKFDALVEFLQANPSWAHKLNYAKERFIRSPNRNYYSTNFFGLYDESSHAARRQISFYYAEHFHQFINTHHPQLNTVPQIKLFLQACEPIIQSCRPVFEQVANDLAMPNIFGDNNAQPPILLKLVKYLPAYAPVRPHYDGTAFSLLLHSTNEQALLLSAYKPVFNMQDFTAPMRAFCTINDQKNMLLIPGTFLTEFGINPTPHIVIPSTQNRYATIAFAMRAHYLQPTTTFTLLPNFKNIE